MARRVLIFNSISNTSRCYGKGIHVVGESLAQHWVSCGMAKFVDNDIKIVDVIVEKKVTLKRPTTKPKKAKIVEEKTVKLTKRDKTKHRNGTSSVGSKRRRPKNTSKGNDIR